MVEFVCFIHLLILHRQAMAESNALNFVKTKCTIISIAKETEGKLGPFSGILKNTAMIYGMLCSMTYSDMFCDVLF